MFGFGYTEVIIILVVVFILCGHRLPRVMRSLGRGMVEFRDPWADHARFRRERKAVGPMSVAEWVVILALAALFVALLLPAWVWRI